MRPYPFTTMPGHMYGPNWRQDLRFHDGTSDIREHVALLEWQRAVRERGFEVEVTGRFDRATQRAAARLQRLADLPVTGMIDGATWDATWSYDPSPPEPEPSPPATPVAAVVPMPAPKRRGRPPKRHLALVA